MSESNATNSSTSPITAKELLLVKVGSDENPATKEDLEAVKAIIEVVHKPTSNMAMITHREIEFQRVVNDNNSVMVFKLGTDERAVGLKEIEDFQRSLAESQEVSDESKVFITYHYVNVVLIGKEQMRSNPIILG
jgi:hypothetical protein